MYGITAECPHTYKHMYGCSGWIFTCLLAWALNTTSVSDRYSGPSVWYNVIKICYVVEIHNVSARFSFEFATEKMMPASTSLRPEMISSHERLFTTSGWFVQMWSNHGESLLREEVPQDWHEKFSKTWWLSSFIVSSVLASSLARKASLRIKIWVATEGHCRPSLTTMLEWYFGKWRILCPISLWKLSSILIVVASRSQVSQPYRGTMHVSKMLRPERELRLPWKASMLSKATKVFLALLMFSWTAREANNLYCHQTPEHLTAGVVEILTPAIFSFSWSLYCHSIRAWMHWALSWQF